MVDALVRSRRGSLAAGAALGGLALIAGLAFRAIRGGEPEAAPDTPFSQVDEDEARLMLRAMVAATVADGLVDADERRRLDEAVEAAGLDRDGRAWLEAELADPASIDAIADPVTDPEAAARIYAAARLAIEADTLQERQFLRMLAEALDVPEAATGRVDRALAG
ncbi:tellurite resistance TerB family protein [Methylobacterium planeticum]|uniref:Tellurite resistance TerB family protein n=2 Tax=Methylobacterium planeticum TaxID=2615211 RepID=A0A6N6MTV8_9HYPH|nr:tellurite resistance TerB family protein [Methylobacterium planeticum]